MDTQDQKNDYNNPPRYNGRIWGGLFLLFLGGIFLMKEMAFPFFPGWFFTWPMILIAVGVFSAIKHGFRGGGWLIMLLIGGFFLVDEATPEINIHKYIVPFIIICVGLSMLLRPRWRRNDTDWWRDRDWRRHRRHDREWRNWGPNPYYNNPSQNQPQDPSSNPSDQQNYSSGPDYSSGPGAPPPAGEKSTEDWLDSVSVFGGVRKVIMSKNFKGGEATSFMGGTELDFTQADINGTVVLELTQVMGGCKLIVPGNWSVKNEVNAVFGGVDDKRHLHTNADPTKVLLLKGTSFLGGLEIRNY
jgi:hypothetical protein